MAWHRPRTNRDGPSFSHTAGGSTMRQLPGLLLGLIFFATGPASAGEKGAKDTIVFLRQLQAPAGGFLAKLSDPGAADTPTLRATTAAIRALHYFGGDVPNPEVCSRFVASCFDAESGGFADSPGGKVDVFSTAVGVMAVVELKMPVKRYGPAAVKY